MADHNQYNETDKSVLKDKSKCICNDCPLYKKKIENAEQINSGKAVLIDMLQKELKKKENLYKDSIDAYEKLRFKHCSVVQELEGLKEIYKSMEDDNNRLLSDKENNKRNQEKLVETLKGELDHWKKQYKDLQDKILPSNDLSQRIGRVEKLLQNQGITMIDLVRKFLEELRNMNAPQLDIPTNCAGTITNDRGDTNQIIKELQDDKDTLNSLVKKLTQENKNFKNRLNDRKRKLSDCLCSLEKNEKNLENLPEYIDGIVQDRDQLREQVRALEAKLDEKQNIDQPKSCARVGSFGILQNVSQQGQLEDDELQEMENVPVAKNVRRPKTCSQGCGAGVVQQVSQQAQTGEAPMHDRGNVRKCSQGCGPPAIQNVSEQVQTGETPIHETRTGRKPKNCTRGCGSGIVQNVSEELQTEEVEVPDIENVRRPKSCSRGCGSERLQLSQVNSRGTRPKVKTRSRSTSSKRRNPERSPTPVPNQMEALEDKYQMLADTVDVLTRANKSNLQTIEDLRKEIEELNNAKKNVTKSNTETNTTDNEDSSDKSPIPKDTTPDKSKKKRCFLFKKRTKSPKPDDQPVPEIEEKPPADEPELPPVENNLEIVKSPAKELPQTDSTKSNREEIIIPIKGRMKKVHPKSAPGSQILQEDIEAGPPEELSVTTNTGKRYRSFTNIQLSVTDLNNDVNCTGDDKQQRTSRNDPAIGCAGALNKTCLVRKEKSDMWLKPPCYEVATNTINSQPIKNPSPRFLMMHSSPISSSETSQNSIEDSSSKKSSNIRPRLGCSFTNMCISVINPDVSITTNESFHQENSKSKQNSKATSIGITKKLNSQDSEIDRTQQCSISPCSELSDSTKQRKKVIPNISDRLPLTISASDSDISRKCSEKSVGCNLFDRFQPERPHSSNSGVQTDGNCQSKMENGTRNVSTHPELPTNRGCTNQECDSKQNSRDTQVDGNGNDDVDPGKLNLNKSSQPQANIFLRDSPLKTDKNKGSTRPIKKSDNDQRLSHRSVDSNVQKSKIPTPVARHSKTISSPEKIPTVKKSSAQGCQNSCSRKGNQEEANCSNAAKDEVIKNLKKEHAQNLKNEYDESTKNNRILEERLKQLEQKLKAPPSKNGKATIDPNHSPIQPITCQKQPPDQLLLNNEAINDKEIATEYDLTGIELIISLLKDKLRELEQELCKKNAVILSLEMCVDRSNNILGDCEKEIKNIVLQNANLKAKLGQLEETAVAQNTNDIQDKISVLVMEYNELLNEAKDKDEELENIKEKYDKLCSLISNKKNDDTSVEPRESVSESDVEVKTQRKNETRNVGALPKKKRRKCLCRDKAKCLLMKCCDHEELSKAETSVGKDTPNKEPPENDNVRKMKGKVMQKSSRIQGKYAQWKFSKGPSKRSLSLTELTRNRPTKDKNMDFVSQLSKSNESTSSTKDENTKKLINEKANLQLKLNSLRNDLNNMMKQQVQMKSGIMNLLNEIISNLKILSDPKDEKITRSDPGKLANEVMDSLGKSLSNKNRCNCMSVITSKYPIDQHGIARNIYQPLFNKFFFDQSSESKSNDSSVEIFDITEIEVSKEFNNSCVW